MALGREAMDFVEKAKIRLEHWLSHNTHHIEEYKQFIEELKKAGELESAKYMEKMIEFVMKSNECLENAIKALRR